VSLAEQISPLVGRWLLGWFFLSEAWARASAWNATLALMAMQHVPAPAVVLVVSLIAMILGGLSLLLGYHVRIGALILFAFTVVVAVSVQDYWNFHDAAVRAATYDLFARDLAVAGGLLLLVGMGSGPFGIDNRMDGRRRR